MAVTTTKLLSPVECASPLARAATSSAPRAIDVALPGRARASPLLAITDFHGLRTTTDAAAQPWATEIHRTHVVPVANASPPVTIETARATSSARLVRRPAVLHGWMGPRDLTASPPQLIDMQLL
jgi:hypothetical protein